jgi:DNA polymerase sigma
VPEVSSVPISQETNERFFAQLNGEMAELIGSF